MDSGDFGGALQLVPGEGLAVNGALHGLEQHRGEELAVGEALQPEMEEQLQVFPLALTVLTALQQEGQRGSDEINGQEEHKEERHLLKVSGIADLRMDLPSHHIPEPPPTASD